MPLRDRQLFGILTVLCLISSAYGLFATVPFGGGAIAPHETLRVASLIFSFSIAIILAWLSLDVIGGTVITALAVITAWLFDLRTGFYGSPLFLLQHVFVSVIGYAFFLARSTVERSYALRSEKMQEEIHALDTAIGERQKSIGVLQHKLVRYATLKGVVESLSTVLSAEEIYQLIIERAIETLDKKCRALLYLVDIDKQELMLVASRNESRIKAKKGDIFDQWILHHRRSLMVDDVTRDFRFPTRETERAAGVFTSLIASPLMGEDKIIGIARMDSAEPRFFSQDDLRLLDVIANLGAVAIQNAHLYARTQELAIHDGLTGLFVRRYFLERFNEEIKRIAGKQGELAVLIIDIDHFKQYNDKYGHTAGDLVLKYLSRVIGGMVREGDIVARYGGEELIIVLSGRTKAKALAEAEEIRAAIAEKPFDLRRHRTNITVSIGIAHYPQDAATEEGLISMADERLYRAKREGRDRVCSR